MQKNSHSMASGYTGLILFFSFFMFKLLFPVQSNAAEAGVQPGEEVRQGTLYYRTAHDNRFRISPVMKTELDMRVTAMINRARVTQTFYNGSDDWVEGVYVFPLPENAAVDHMRIRVGNRLIEGKIKERAQAKKIYQRAKREGKRASLVEQERPNMFTTSVANIGPREKVHIEIEFQHDLQYDGGLFRLRLPFAITPRYIPGHTADKNNINSHGSSQSTSQVPDADRITPFVVVNEKINPVSLHIELDAGFPLNDVRSTYHAINKQNHGEGRYSISLAEGDVPADRDFELVWEPVQGYEPRTALFHEEVAGEHYYFGMVLPPEHEGRKQTLSREVVYVVDTSGSMGGISIQQARNALLLALKRLRPGDYFNVIQFNSFTSKLFPESKPVNSINKAIALRYVRNLEANGGTEMMSAMQQALKVENDKPRLRQIVFLTDGAIGNESALFEYIRHKLGQGRLFTVGIGAAPNSHFMTKAAKFGRGTYTHISKVSEVAEKMKALFAKLDSPVMRDLRINHALTGFELLPDKLPDLYLGEPVMFSLRTTEESGELVIEGKRVKLDWHKQLFLQQANEGKGVAQLWARHKIKQLMNSVYDGADGKKVRDEIVKIALQHHMVSKYTSLVAVDVTPVRPGDEILKTRAVPTNLPHGQQADKIFGLQARTGTAQYLLLVSGFILLMLALYLKTVIKFNKQAGCKPSCVS